MSRRFSGRNIRLSIGLTESAYIKLTQLQAYAIPAQRRPITLSEMANAIILSTENAEDRKVYSP